MVLIDDQNILGNENIALDMYQIFGSDLRAPVNHAVVINNDDRISLLFRLQADAQAGILLHSYMAAQLDSVCLPPVDLARMMN
jgi:hypothetical protein